MIPTVHIGGQLDYIGGSTRVGGHDTFVVEACEFNASFLHFHPTIAVVTNIEEDHLDFYKDLDDIAHAFARFCDASAGKRRRASATATIRASRRC